ncbi:S-protein-like protein 5-like [Senna tora]|uniref:S-protein homolog n=1 Tax=Senna tora TaxID=362788 RepID=A0A834TQR8_9FABA|nr:S-protein-like protein 5-like [Senna tora]
MLSNAKAPGFPGKVTVLIWNGLTPPQDLTLHCKDKHHDLGEHTLKYGEVYEFKFIPNIFWYATLYFCSFKWPSDPSLHHFDIYDQERDFCKSAGTIWVPPLDCL